VTSPGFFLPEVSNISIKQLHLRLGEWLGGKWDFTGGVPSGNADLGAGAVATFPKSADFAVATVFCADNRRAVPTFVHQPRACRDMRLETFKVQKVERGQASFAANTAGIEA